MPSKALQCKTRYEMVVVALLFNFVFIEIYFVKTQSIRGCYPDNADKMVPLVNNVNSCLSRSVSFRDGGRGNGGGGGKENSGLDYDFHYFRTLTFLPTSFYYTWL